MSDEYEFHAAANLFPILDEGEEFDRLVQDIKDHGLREPIWLFDGKILDGRNRYLACKAAEVEPHFRESKDNSPVAFAISVNLHRRHLTPSQRAAIGVEAERLFAEEAKERQRLSQGRGKKGPERIPDHKGEARDKAAKLVDVNPRYISDAKKIGELDPEKLEEVKWGEKTIPAAKRELAVKELRKEKNDPALVDKVGRPVPADLVSEWQRAEKVGKHLRGLAREIKNTAEQGFAGPKQDKMKDLIYAEVGNAIIAEAGALAYTLDSIIPYALCPTCQGRLSNNCTFCRKRGWISRFLWNSPAVSDKTKELIGRAAS